MVDAGWRMSDLAPLISLAVFIFLCGMYLQNLPSITGAQVKTANDIRLWVTPSSFSLKVQML
jgi:hypothetical protein